MKLCNGCREVKPLSEFHKNKGRKSGVNSRCKPCRAIVDHERYEAKVGRSAPRPLPRTERGRAAWLVGLKTGRPCADCGRVFPHQVMQWDHLPGFEKRGDISQSSWGRTREELVAEIAKCELVCANCHAIRTFGRNGWATRWIKDDAVLYDTAWASYAAA